MNTTPVTLRLPQSEYDMLTRYAEQINSSEVSQAVRNCVNLFLFSPELCPNVELEEAYPSKQTSVSLPKGVYEQLRSIARERDVSIAYLLRLAIHYGLQ